MFGHPIEYDMPVYRPPSEGRSLLIQVTIGCSNNKCTYCDMYRSKSYRERSFVDIERELISCHNNGMKPDKIFLCDGDALGAPMELLEKTLLKINELFPKRRRIGVYATADNILKKSEDELISLHELGLEIAYLGLESGDDKILHMIVKGNSADEMKQASLKLKRCGLKLSTIVMLGVGGTKYTDQHIKATAKMISETNPEFLSFLTTFSVPGTPYHKMVERGLIEPLTSFMLLREMRGILNNSSFEINPVIFRANHVSNQMPLGGTLGRDKEKLIKTIDYWMANTPKDSYPVRPDSM